MRPDDAKIRLTRQWLTKAKQDMQAAERLLSGGPVLGEPALFHCQQAAEKALKAFLVWHDHPFPKTHDLVELVKLGATHEPQVAPLADAADALTPYAVVVRYPPFTAAPTAEQSAEALRLARQVLACVRGWLPPEVQP